MVKVNAKLKGYRFDWPIGYDTCIYILRAKESNDTTFSLCLLCASCRRLIFCPIDNFQNIVALTIKLEWNPIVARSRGELKMRTHTSTPCTTSRCTKYCQHKSFQIVVKFEREPSIKIQKHTWTRCWTKTCSNQISSKW